MKKYNKGLRNKDNKIIICYYKKQKNKKNNNKH